MSNTENFKNKENLKQIDWVDSEIKAELSALGQNVDSFYEVKQDSIEFKEDVVKQYLVKLRDEVKDMETKAAWQHLASKENNSAWIMAVQIALEKLGYEVGKIDGVLGKETRNGVLRFQTQCDLGGKDGFPGKETITKLCEALDKPDQFAAKSESKPVTGSVSDSSTSTESSGVSGGGEQSSQSSAGSTVVEQQKASEGNERIDTVNGKKCKVLSLDSIDKLLEENTRKDPENYDVLKKETYPTVYQFKGVGGFYTFYSNGRCKLPDGSMNNTKVIVEKLKNGRFETEELGDAQFIQSEIQKMGNVSFDYNGKKYNVGVKINVDQDRSSGRLHEKHKIELYLKDISTPYFVTSFSVGDLLDRNGEFSREYFEKVILQQAKTKLMDQYNANNVFNGLSKRSKEWRGNWEWIFGEGTKKSRSFDKYFKTFKDEAISLDMGGWDGPYVKFQLNNNGWNSDFNKLKVHYSELADKDGNFNEESLRQCLKKNITEIVNKHFK